MAIARPVSAAIILTVALLARPLGIARDRQRLTAAITEAKARENAAPLSTAILTSNRRSSA